MISTELASGGPHPQSSGAEVDESMADEQLLARFLGGDHDSAEAAFRAIVVRHGPMVLGVCRQVLGRQQDAEDAFQAAFLVLARKAGSIRDGRVLGRWLYEVGFRIAVRIRANDKRRRTHERQGAVISSPAADQDVQWNDLRPVLHEEVNRLPEKYRTPVVLCYLEGKTNEEVARLMNWPVGTVKGRLSRAREILRSRLARRGLALSAALLLLGLTHDSVIADEVSNDLIDHTVQSGVRIAKGEPAGPGAVSPEAVLLMDLDLAATSAFTIPPRVTRLLLVIAALIFLLGLGASFVPGIGETFPLSLLFSPNPPAAGACHSAPAACPAP